MKQQLILFLSSISFLTSCGQTNRLTEEDYKWMPYKGTETLVFNSNNGESDTIFLLRKDTLLAYPEAQSVKGVKYQVVSIFCKHTDPNQIDGVHRYLENHFIQIEKSKDDNSELNILLSAKDATFYRMRPIKIDSLKQKKPLTLQTKYGAYDDVYVVNAEDYLDGLRLRSNFVEKIYWSRSQGLIRYDKSNDVYWELAIKY